MPCSEGVIASVIEDRELRELFRAESLEHIQHIETGLLALERQPEDTALLEEVFRESHSLKGAARMLGLRDIQNLAHEIESLLGEARQGKMAITAISAGAQLAKLDQIRRQVAMVVGDSALPETNPATVMVPASPAPPVPSVPAGPSGQGTVEVAPGAAGLMTSTAVVASAAEPPQATSGPGETSSALVTPDVKPSATANGGPVKDFHIDTLRIESTRLDTLLQLGGELVVNNGRIARWRGELDRLHGHCDYLNRHPGDSIQGLSALVSELDRLRGLMSSDIARLETVSSQLETSIRKLRLLPLSTLLDLFPRMVRDLAAELGKKVVYHVEGAATVADKRIIEEMKAPLTHLLRNCVDHGIETPAERLRAGKPAEGLIQISVAQGADAVTILIRDDGRGLDLEAIRQQAIKQRLHTEDELRHMSSAQLQTLVLRAGFSTSPMITDLSGRGVGLDVVRACVERLHGSLALDSTPGRGLSIRLRLPVSLTATRAILVREWGQTYALSFDDIAFLRRLAPAALHNLEGRQGFYEGDQAIPLERLGLLLDRSPPALKEEAGLHCVVLKVSGEIFALAVDEVLDTEDIVVKPPAPPLTRVRNLAGLAVLNSGLVCPVLNSYDLLRGMNRKGRVIKPSLDQEVVQAQKRILLAEDSITTRMQERRILEAAGYLVETAVDGLDAWNKLALHSYDAVVSDIQMPRMSGLELAERMRKNKRFAEVPIVLITSLATEEDRRRGLAAGADAYITKSEFDQRLLLDCLARLA